MFVLRASLAVGLALALSAAVVAAPNPAQARRANNGRGVEGVVVHVHHARSPRGSGTIKIRAVRRHQRRAGAAAAVGRARSRHNRHVMTFHVNRSTRFQRLVRAGNGQIGERRTSFAALRRGERVRILPGSGARHAARRVNILANGGGSTARRAGSGRRYAVSRPHLVGRRVGTQGGGHRSYVRRVSRPVYVTRTMWVQGGGRHHGPRHHMTHARHAPAKVVKHTSAVHHKPQVKHTTAPKPVSHKPGASHMKPKPAHSKPHKSSHRKR